MGLSAGCRRRSSGTSSLTARSRWAGRSTRQRGDHRRHRHAARPGRRRGDHRRAVASASPTTPRPTVAHHRRAADRRHPLRPARAVWGTPVFAARSARFVRRFRGRRARREPLHATPRARRGDPATAPDRAARSGAVLRGRGVRQVLGGVARGRRRRPRDAHGEVLGVIGPNGAGQEHADRPALRRHAPTPARVELFGEDVTGLGAQARARLRRRPHAPGAAAVRTAHRSREPPGGAVARRRRKTGGLPRREAQRILDRCGLERRSRTCPPPT